MATRLSDMYKEIHEDPFPSKLEMAFYDDAGKRSSLFYEKVEWTIEGERRGLRYGENPDQSAALYRLINGNLSLGGAATIQPGKWLVSDAELLQSGKHPGKTNLTDVDSALNILRYFPGSPACAIMKHNNPSGAAKAASLREAYYKAFMADRVAAFGGAVVVNRTMDLETARIIADSYCEVVAAPDFEGPALDVFRKKKNLRVIRIANAANLEKWIGERTVEFRTLIDGGCVAQVSFVPRHLTKEGLLEAAAEREGRSYRVEREPTDGEYDDMLFGWLVETGVTSNSVIYVKDGVTVGIGTGEQDRVGVAEIARDKAYRKLEDRICYERFGTPWNLFEDEAKKAGIREEVAGLRGGLKGSVMVSDAYFPFRDGIEVGLREGVTAVIQPGGSLRDFESIEVCNEYGAAMKFTGQRCFRH